MNNLVVGMAVLPHLLIDAVFKHRMVDGARIFPDHAPSLLVCCAVMILQTKHVVAFVYAVLRKQTWGGGLFVCGGVFVVEVFC
jgi:hypothetical protein